MFRVALFRGVFDLIMQCSVDRLVDRGVDREWRVSEGVCWVVVCRTKMILMACRLVGTEMQMAMMMWLWPTMVVERLGDDDDDCSKLKLAHYH